MTLIWHEMSLTCNSRIDEDVGKYEEGAQLSIKASHSHGLLFNLFFSIQQTVSSFTQTSTDFLTE